jgi:hypothetical protein
MGIAAVIVEPMDGGAVGADAYVESLRHTGVSVAPPLRVPLLRSSGIIWSGARYLGSEVTDVRRNEKAPRRK